MKRASTSDLDRRIQVTRCLIGYVWLIVLFSSVILIVQTSMEVKRVRYAMTEKNFEKMRLLDEIRRIDNEISELERFSRISNMVETNLPHLGPPRQAAIEIEIEGLEERSGLTTIPFVYQESPSLLSKIRHQWQEAEKQVRQWIRTLIE